jgi:hypothetical protein
VTSDQFAMSDPEVFARIVVIRRDGKDGAVFPLSNHSCLFGRLVCLRCFEVAITQMSLHPLTNLTVIRLLYVVRLLNFDHCTLYQKFLIFKGVRVISVTHT